MKPFSPKTFSVKPVRAKSIDREGLEQAALIKEISLRYPAASKLIYHVPNGGHRHKLVAVKLKEQGVKAGVPDLVLPMPVAATSGCTSNSRPGRRMTLPSPQPRTHTCRR